MMHQKVYITLWAVLLLISFVFTKCEGSNSSSWTCPEGWMQYTADTPFTCVQVNHDNQNSRTAAHEECGKKNSSLIVVNTDNKHQFMLELMALSSDDSFWMGLQKVNGRLKWLTKDGGVLASRTMPKKFKTASWYDDAYYDTYKGHLYRSSGFLRKTQRYYENKAKYICEKRPECALGFFGKSCENECHCHGAPCDPKDLKGVCPNGCQIGWMGSSCRVAKESAEVKYHCVRSRDQGDYVHIRIHTKGVRYDKIQAVNDNGELVPWCNSTRVTYNSYYMVKTIQIYTDRNSTEDMANGNCPGKVVNSSYSWEILIQEKQGFESQHDQRMHITCDAFTKYETMSTSGETAIQMDDHNLEELPFELEGVTLRVVDAYSGVPVLSAPVGSSVRLQIAFGAGANDASDLMPYNCHATSPNGDDRIHLTDNEGCSLSGSILSAFAHNGSKSLITKPFRLVRLPGSKSILFHCSFSLCYDNDPCYAGCRRDFIDGLPPAHGHLHRDYPSRRTRSVDPPSTHKVTHAMEVNDAL